MHALVLALVLSAQPAPAAAPAPDAEALRATVDAYLNAIDTPITAERWKALGPAAAPLLAGVADDPAELPVTRARAVWALSMVDPAAASPVARRIAADAGAHPVTRASALRAMGRLLPAAQVRAAVSPLLRGEGAPELRAVAAEVLARHGGAAGCDEVRAQLAAEAVDDRPVFHRAEALCR